MHNTVKPKPLHEVMDPPPATQNSKSCKPNYNSYSKKRKLPLHKYKSFGTNKQTTQDYSNELPPTYKIQPTAPQHTRHSYLAA